MNLFKYIKEHVTIMDVVAQYTTVKKAGLYWKGHCPFHTEKTASFTVSPHKEIFYCFGCQTGGDVITFIEKAEHLSAYEATCFLADRYNIQLPDSLEASNAPLDKKVTEKQRHHLLCSLVAQWCQGQGKKNPETLSYLKSRTIPPTIIDKFNVGYFPGGAQSINNLLAFIKKHNFLAQDLIQASLIGNSKKLFSPFEERIIFPIGDHLGRVCGFGGRIFKAQDQRAKYYNSRENNFFSKGSLLYGFNQAKHSIQKHQAVFLVEGYTDCLAMVNHGYENTIATLGTACTLEQLQHISRYAHIVYVLFDGDKAGNNAVLRLAELCWQVDLDLKIIQLPEAHDPASFLTSSEIEVGTMASLVQQATDIFVFFINSLGNNFHTKTLKQKMQSAQRLLSLISIIKEPIKQEVLLQKAAQVFEIPFDSFKKELGALNNEHAKPEDPPLARFTSPPNPDLNKISLLEKKLFSVIINNMELIEYQAREIIDYFSEPLQTILKKAQLLQLSKQGGTVGNLLLELNDYERSIVSHLLIEFQDYENKPAFSALFERFAQYHWKLAVNKLKTKLIDAQNTNNQSEIKNILHELQSIKQKLLKERTKFNEKKEA